MKNIARKITLFLLSAIVMVTMLPSHAQAAVSWHLVPTGVQSVDSDYGNLAVNLDITCSIASPTEDYYLKLTCVETAAENYYGTDYLIGLGSGTGDIIYAVAGQPMTILDDYDAIRDYPPAGSAPLEVHFFNVNMSAGPINGIVETGKHYTVQLVKTSNGGATYTAVGDSFGPIEIIDSSIVPPAPTAETPVVPEHPYWWSCYNEILELGESNEPQTLVYEEGTALPIEIMQALQECPNVTLIFKCRYNDTDYEFTIPGDKSIVIDDIPWYGPLWLNQHYSAESSATDTGNTHLVVSGDTLSKIAVTYNTTVDDLLSKNAFIRDKDKIYAGQLISY